MRQQGNCWIMRLVTVFCFGTALFCAPRSEAAEQLQMAMAATTEDDLLMFWEEKELYVQTATRSEKLLTQTAENMTVITAKDIEVMNANSISEVLARVPGVYVDFSTNEYLSNAQIHIQGSDSRHVTVLLDGVPVNLLSAGLAETGFIPLKIVERIEIIKGAASSAWGSALGGVINIITRSTGDNATPDGMLSASYGKANSRDLAGDLRGKNGPLGYYLYAGQTDSDGLLNNRSYSRTSLFGKLLLTPSRDLDITLSGAFSNPENYNGEVPSQFSSNGNEIKDLLLSGAVEYRTTPELTIRGGLHLFRAKLDQSAHWLSASSLPPGLPASLADRLFQQNIWDEQTFGGSLRATWISGIQALTVGAEGSRGEQDQTVNYGPYFQLFPAANPKYRPPTVSFSSRIDKYGLFANDTVEFGALSVTPGIRYDQDSITGSFISPSLGATYELGEHTVARASAARGFTSPALSYLAGGGPYSAANSNLKAEYGWSYQAGLESGVADLANLSATLFRHETTNAITPVAGTTINQGEITRQGYELQADSVPFYNLSLKLGHSYAHFKGSDMAQPPNGYDSTSYDNYSWLIGVKYDDRQSLSALLSGRYVWWDYAKSSNTKYDTFIWDLTATRKFRTSDKTTLDTFLSLHNIFSGDYYSVSYYPNPGIWLEGGLRFKF